MKMGLSVCVFLCGLLLTCAGLRVLGPSGPLTVKLGGSVMLPCYIDPLVPLEELEVEWKRSDSESLVSLFQDGEIRPEAQSQAYSERASFFPEEIQHRNFSLLLTNVTTEDTGVYNCSVYRQHQFAQISVQIKEIERLTLTGGHEISAYVGEAVTLNCSLDSHIPPEKIEEISWKRAVSQIPVLIFQEGEIQTESSHERYMDRVEFFSLDEIHKGNFSLRLKDLRTEDKGLYICEAFAGEFSANATVEVRQLGFSSLHIGVLFICALAFAFPVCLSSHAYTFLKRDDNRRTAMSVQYVYVIVPNFFMFLAFILWGVIEGFFREAATCSALNLLRIALLFKIAPYLSRFQDFVHRVIKHSGITLETAVITTVAYSGVFLRLWKLYQEKQDTFMLVFLGVLLTTLLGYYIGVLYSGFTKTNTGILNYILTVLINLIRGLLIILSYGQNLVTVVLQLLLQLLPMVILFVYDVCLGKWKKLKQESTRNKRKNIFVFMLMSILIAEALNTPVSVCIHNMIPETDKDRAGLICVTVYLHILTVMLLFEDLSFYFESHVNTVGIEQSQGGVQENTRFRETSNQTASCGGISDSGGNCRVVVYILGTVAPICVNSIALAVELILKARNGERTVEDLRVILFPAECVFALCFLTLQISEFSCWMSSVVGVGRRQWTHEHELVVLRSTQAEPAPQETGT